MIMVTKLYYIPSQKYNFVTTSTHTFSFRSENHLENVWGGGKGGLNNSLNSISRV